MIRFVGRFLRVSNRRPCKSFSWTDFGILTPAGRPYVSGSWEEDLAGLGVDFGGDLGTLVLGMEVDLGIGEEMLPPDDRDVRGMGASICLGGLEDGGGGEDAPLLSADAGKAAGASTGFSTGAGAVSITNVRLDSRAEVEAGASTASSTASSTAASTAASGAASSAASSSSDPPPKRSSSSEPSAFSSVAVAALGS